MEVVTAYFNRSLQFQEDGLIDENISTFQTKSSDLLFGQIDLFPGSATIIQIKKVDRLTLELQGACR